MDACLVFTNPSQMKYNCEMLNLPNKVGYYDHDMSTASKRYYSSYEYNTLILSVNIKDPIENAYVGIKASVKDRSIRSYCDWKAGAFSSCLNDHLIVESNVQCTTGQSSGVNPSWDAQGSCVKLTTATKTVEINQNTTCFDAPAKSIVVFHPTNQIQKYFGKVDIGSESVLILNKTGIIGADFTKSGKIYLKSLEKTTLPLSVFDMSWNIPSCEFTDIIVGPYNVMVGTPRMSVTRDKYQHFIKEKQTVCYIALNANTENMRLTASTIKLKMDVYDNKGQPAKNLSNLPSDFMVKISYENENEIAVAGYEPKSDGSYTYQGIIGNVTGRNPSSNANFYRYRVFVENSKGGDDSQMDGKKIAIIAGSVSAVVIIIIVIVIVSCCCCCKKKKESASDFNP